MLRLAALVVLIATQASAGAWPREEGEVFLSFGGNVALLGEAARPVYYDPTIYLEYGLTPRLTLGLDGFTADKGEAGSLFFFLRFPLWQSDAGDRFALSLGTGATIMPNGAFEETPRVSLHWGLGLEDGWMAADAEVKYGLTRSIAQTKIDVTWGYRIDGDWSSVLVGTAGIGLEGDFYAKLSPSILYQVNETLSLRAGMVQALTGDLGTGISAEAWVRF